MLYKISIANIKKSFKDYAVYFFTLILGIAIFYVFNAIDSQAVLLDVTSNTYEIISLMTNILSFISVFVSFILGFLIIYASRFLIKRRNKEFGIYLTLGMSKRKISTILFFETLLIGIISLVIGLIVGVISSQFMSLLVANMFNANMTKFTFIFSKEACLKTIIYFAVMYIIVMIFNTISINKCKLIDLLHGSKKSEKIKLKNPIVCTIIFIISCIALGIAYYLVTAGISKLKDVKEILIPISLGAISTFLIFWSLSGLILRIVRSMKKVYYKGLNIFTLRQFSSKINTTVFSMTIICLMLFITICVLSACLNLKNSLEKNAITFAPADIMISKNMNLTLDKRYDEEAVEYSKYDIETELENKKINIDSNFKKKINISLYGVDNLTLNNTLGSKLIYIRTKYPFLQYDALEDIIKITDYNKVAKMYGLKQYTLNDDEYMTIANFKSMVEVRNIALKNKETITIYGRTLSPKYDECMDGYIELASQRINSGIIIVPDNIVDESTKKYDILIADYNANTKSENKEVEEKVLKIINDNLHSFSYNTKNEVITSSVGLGALVTFIGLYLGIIFLISSAAILALKELSESADNKERFRMIRKLGADEKMINKALFNQIGIFFALPLILAIIHSIFGIIFSVKILEIFGTEQLLPSIIMTAIFIIIIYGGYFLLTYACSKSIIKERLRWNG